MTATGSRDTRIKGNCPMGCGETLFVGEGGYITCSYVECPRPDAASDILAGRETEHIVSLGEEAFTVRHPLRERLDDALMQCDLHEFLASLDGPPEDPGRYRVRWPDESWEALTPQESP